MGAIHPTQPVGRGTSEPPVQASHKSPGATSALLRCSQEHHFVTGAQHQMLIGKRRKPRWAVNHQQQVFFPKSSRSGAAPHVSDTSPSVSRSSWFLGLVLGGFFGLLFVRLVFFKQTLSISVHFITELQNQQAAKGPH